jgi:hypothetical protein
MALTILVIVGCALFGRLAFLAKPFDSDAAMFVYMGKMICQGGRLCHDLVDNKFPTVGLMTSVFWRVFGTWWPGYVLVQTAMMFAGAGLLARSACKHIHPSAGWGTFLAAITYLNLNIAVFGGFQLEGLQVFFAIIAAVAAMEALTGGALADSFVAGLSSGCAAMCKPTGLAVVGAFALAMLLTRQRRLIRHALATSLGLAIPAAVVLAYLIGSDTLKDMPALYRQIKTYASSSVWDWVTWSKPFTVAIVAGLPMLFRGWVFRRDRRADSQPIRPIIIFVVAWLTIEMVGVIAQGRMYAYHFFVVGPPVALLLAMIPRKDRAMTLLASLGPLALFSFYGACQVVGKEYRPSTRLAASEYLIAHAQPGDAVWQDDYPRLLLETGLRPGSRVPLTFLFLNSDKAPAELSSMILSDWRTVRPKYIVFWTDLNDWLKHQNVWCAELAQFPSRRDANSNAWHAMQDYVMQHYVAEQRLGRETVYRLRS